MPNGQEFVYTKEGHEFPKAKHVDFLKEYGVENMMRVHGHHPNDIEGAHDTKDGTIAINTGWKDANGNPPTDADLKATHSHEAVHQQVNELAKKTKDPASLKFALNANAINAINADGKNLAQHIGAYYLATKEAAHKPESGKFVDPSSAEIQNEVTPHLASIATPNSGHQQAFLKFMKKRDPSVHLGHIHEAWNRAVTHAANFALPDKARAAPKEPAKPAAPFTTGVRKKNPNVQSYKDNKPKKQPMIKSIDSLVNQWDELKKALNHNTAIKAVGLSLIHI